MAIEVQPPNLFVRYMTPKYVTIFAGGSIEMGTAKPWQHRVVTAFKEYDDVVILNPRRDEWDSTWKQTKGNRVFRKQVQWELEGLEKCDAAIIYLQPGTKSPISLLELGLFGEDPSGGNEMKMHVVCPPGFWRKGNVDIVCERYHIPQFTSVGAAIKHIKSGLEGYRKQKSSSTY